MNVQSRRIDRKQAEDRLHRVGITVNRNAVPLDPRPPMVSSGVRIGTPALATRGFDLDGSRGVADIISLALRPDTDDAGLAALRDRVDVLARRFPLYPALTTAEL
jgi:glycine hydroxymethyltransferase